MLLKSSLLLLLLLLLSRFSRVRLCDPRDGSPPGSPVPGILQARTLAWVAISFSNAWRWKVKVKSLSPVWLWATPRTAAYQAPSMGFSRQGYWRGVPLPSPNTLQRSLVALRWILARVLASYALGSISAHKASLLWSLLDLLAHSVSSPWKPARGGISSCTHAHFRLEPEAPCLTAGTSAWGLLGEFQWQARSGCESGRLGRPISAWWCWPRRSILARTPTSWLLPSACLTPGSLSSMSISRGSISNSTPSLTFSGEFWVFGSEKSMFWGFIYSFIR